MTIGEDFYNPKLSDYITLGGKRINQSVIVTSPPDRNYNWDEQQGMGLAGSWVRFTGLKAAHFALQFRMLDEADVTDFDLISNESRKGALLVVKFKLSKNGKPIGVSPMDIIHPAINQMNVGACVVARRGAIVDAGKGLRTCDVDFIEYRPPPKINVNKKSDGPVSGKEDVKPRTESEQQLEQARRKLAAVEAEEARRDAGL